MNNTTIHYYLFFIILSALAIVNVIIIFLGWHNPLLDLHYFRQTQTALSTFWMIREHHILPYETPVLGYPWFIPFEFPGYQWIVSGIYHLNLWGLDQCGRLVSILFYYLCFIPLYFLYKDIGLTKRHYLIF